MWTAWNGWRQIFIETDLFAAVFVGRMFIIVAVHTTAMGSFDEIIERFVRKLAVDAPSCSLEEDILFHLEAGFKLAYQRNHTWPFSGPRNQVWCNWLLACSNCFFALQISFVVFGIFLHFFSIALVDKSDATRLTKSGYSWPEYFGRVYHNTEKR